MLIFFTCTTILMLANVLINLNFQNENESIYCFCKRNYKKTDEIELINKKTFGLFRNV